MRRTHCISLRCPRNGEHVAMNVAKLAPPAIAAPCHSQAQLRREGRETHASPDTGQHRGSAKPCAWRRVFV